MYDAVKLFVLAMRALDNSTTVTISQLRCEGEQAWIHGNSLINYMKLVSVSLSGYYTRLFSRSNRRFEEHCNRFCVLLLEMCSAK